MQVVALVVKMFNIFVMITVNIIIDHFAQADIAGYQGCSLDSSRIANKIKGTYSN